MHFVIEDTLHSEWQGEFKTLVAAISELKRRASIPWVQKPNRAPCIGWKTCGRAFEIIEFDVSSEPWKEIRRVGGFEISESGVKWNLYHLK